MAGSKLGRKQKPFQTSWGEIIPGLNRQVDGRWRIVETGYRFTEADERRAIQRFRDMTARPTEKIKVPFARAVDGARLGDVIREMQRPTAPQPVLMPDPTSPPWERPYHLADGPPTYLELKDDDTYELYRGSMNADAVWHWFREQLIERPEHVAKMTGIPELAGLRHLPLPRAGLKLTAVIANYRTHNPSTDKAKNEAIKALQRLIDHAQAKTLHDLTTEKLLSFKQSIESDPRLTSAGTRKGYYGRIKSVVSFGLKTGMDATQIGAFLARAKVLWTAEPMPEAKPTPIGREDFHALLNAGNGSWRPWLLLGLNLCLHLEEVCELRWEHFDLEAGTYACIRNKTRKARVPRAAVLWRETLEALKRIKRTGSSPYVFVSTHGDRYNRNTRGNDFAELRGKAGVQPQVTFDWVRDGSYTAAINDKHVEERFARVMAGHASPGLQDRYVLRNPRCTQEACEAVHRAYGPFPEPKK